MELELSPSSVNFVMFASVGLRSKVLVFYFAIPCDDDRELSQSEATRDIDRKSRSVSAKIA